MTTRGFSATASCMCCARGRSYCGADDAGYGHVPYPSEGVCAREIFSAIARAHWNVNAKHEHLEAQRLRMKRGAASNGSVGNQHREADGGD